MTIEDEVKVTLPPDVALPDLSDAKAGLVADPRPPVTLTSVYYDTEDVRLLAAGITVRRRVRGRAVTWDVKVPVRRGDLRQRHEVSFKDRSAEPPEPVTALLRAWLGGDPLAPVATLRTRRTAWTVRDADGGEVAEVVDDDVAHLSGRSVVATFREVEVERRAAAADGYVARVSRRLAKAGGTPSSVSKLGRVLVVPRPAFPRVRSGGALSALVAAALRHGTTDLLLADAGARLRGEDAVHQMRVSCRRLRSVLRAFGDVLDPAWRDEVGTELRWVGDALGAARDAEVLAARLAVAADDLGATAAPLLDDVVARSAAADDAVTEVLGSERYLALAARLRAETVSPPFADAPEPTAGAAAKRVVSAAWRDVERCVRRARKRGAPAATWHAVRIAAKRARYTAECATPVAGKDGRRVAKAAAAVQDALGVFHDTAGSVVLLASLASDRADDTAYGYVAGRLTERELRAGAAALRSFDAVWRKVTR